MAQDLRTHFHHELDEVRDQIVRLAAMVTEALPRATEALLTNNLAEAQRIIEADDELDELWLDIEERCYRLLTLQGPMASDMRAIVAALKLNSEFERSGDLVVNICKALRRMYAMNLDPRLRGLVTQMSEEAVRLTRLAVDAYVEGNAGLAAALDDIDDRLDELQTDYVEAIFAAHDREEIDLACSVQLALIGRYYERIGDHAVNIGERVQYMVTGWMPEYAGATRAQARRELNGPDDGSAASVAEDEDGDGAD